jgi:hypothetical protein
MLLLPVVRICRGQIVRRYVFRRIKRARFAIVLMLMAGGRNGLPE